MIILVDSDVLIDHLRGHAGAGERLRDALAGGERVTASVVTKAEILAGMREHEVERTLGVLNALEWVEVDDGVATLAGALARSHRAAHPGIGLPDYLIAATAQALAAELWTCNPRHFPMFEGLTPPYRR